MSLILMQPPGSSAPVDAADGIHVLAAQFGTLGAHTKLDIVAPLQALCGSSATSCSVFCSESSFGRYRLGRRPICRVAFRCPDLSVHAVEAGREDLIVMRCDEDEEAAVAADSAADLQPPPYVEPRR